MRIFALIVIFLPPFLIQLSKSSYYDYKNVIKYKSICTTNSCFLCVTSFIFIRNTYYRNWYNTAPNIRNVDKMWSWMNKKNYKRITAIYGKVTMTIFMNPIYVIIVLSIYLESQLLSKTFIINSYENVICQLLVHLHEIQKIIEWL